ncbi:MAG: hypothetical protein JGK21_04580 [Microcoleus sp. PH2017_22_RUC_O_B]|uniref:hypothetical protein n=1 Tax=unclassified Microcoleus TaxID=2642155 RepID=UPI001D83EF0B|nr:MULTISPECIES: hypothetical protein [unclassified Microcoleus]MCC3527571.1 hypothetical protein [Microcoleus sp. PH2017_21_RUC_O_A]MCC3539664.1 hypothetical protein [Microcoleus sp. PH2017_22_RUC_O_B]
MFDGSGCDRGTITTGIALARPILKIHQLWKQPKSPLQKTPRLRSPQHCKLIG